MSKLVQIIDHRKASKDMKKLSKKNHVLFEAVFKQADEICINPQHYKNLNYPLNKYRRVHIDSSASSSINCRIELNTVIHNYSIFED